jgi:hypothetical protein
VLKDTWVCIDLDGERVCMLLNADDLVLLNGSENNVHILLDHTLKDCSHEHVYTPEFGRITLID